MRGGMYLSEAVYLLVVLSGERMEAVGWCCSSLLLASCLGFSAAFGTVVGSFLPLNHAGPVQNAMLTCGYKFSLWALVINSCNQAQYSSASQCCRHCRRVRYMC